MRVARPCLPNQIMQARLCCHETWPNCQERRNPSAQRNAGSVRTWRTNGWACCTLQRFWKGQGRGVEWGRGCHSDLPSSSPLRCCTSGCLIIDHCCFPIGLVHAQEATCNPLHDARGARDRAKAPSIRGIIYWLVFRMLAAKPSRHGPR
jgi:hypothetical protein